MQLNQALYSAASQLKLLGVILAVVITAATLIQAKSVNRKNNSRNNGSAIVMGTGNHRYEWVSGWVKLPAEMKLGNMHGAVQSDTKGLIYISAEGENAVLVFDQNGKFIRGFGKEWKTDKPGDGVHGMQLVRENGREYLYLTHLGRHEFAKITLTGEVIWVKGYPEQSGVYTKADEFKPTGIAVAPNGDFYVTDGYGKNYVHRYNAKGEYQNSWGGKSSGPKETAEDGKFNTPHAILIDLRGVQPTVLVTDRANSRLQWFSLEGKHLKTLPGTGDLLRLPAVLHQRGTDIVVGDLSGRVSIFDKNNDLVTHLGDNVDPKKRATNKITPDQWLDGQFVSPHGICWDRNGNLYIEEWLQNGRVVKLKRLK
jgi:DNA-binding beta-propeller fold protein YncE